jgi:hypothetical protein
LACLPSLAWWFTEGAAQLAITSQHKASRPRVIVVTLVILVMFLSRACFDLFSAVGYFNLSLDGGVSVWPG